MANTTDRQRLAAALPFSDATLVTRLAAETDTASSHAATTSLSSYQQDDAPTRAAAAADETITINPISIDNTIGYYEHGNATVVSGYVRQGNPGDTVTVTLHGKSYSGTLGNDAMWYVTVPESDIAQIPNGKVTVNASHIDSTGVAHEATSQINLLAGTASPSVPTLFLNKVTGDDVLSAVERGGDLLISGWGRNIGEGYEVTVTLNGHQYHATTTKDSRWTISVPQEDVQALPEGKITLLASLGHEARVAEVAKTLTLNNEGAGKASPSLEIDTVSADDTISLYEIGATTFLTGHASNIPAGSRIKLTIADKVFYGEVTSDGVWSVKVGQLYNAKNANSTHAVVSWQDSDGNEVAASREIHLVPSSYPYKYPMAFQIDTISVDGKVDAQEGRSDLIITGSKFSGENLGFGETVYVTLNGKTYTGVVEGGNYDNHWQITVPASDVQALPPGSYTVIASINATLNTGESVNSTQTKTFTVLDPDLAFNPISVNNAITNNEHGNATVISGYAYQGTPGDTVLITLHGKTYSGTLGNDGMWAVTVPESDIAAIPGGKVTVTADHTDSAGVDHHVSTQFTLTNSSNKVPTLAVNKVTGDDVLSAVERGGELLISGWGRYIDSGHEVQVMLNGHTYSTKTTTDSRWVITVPKEDVQALPDGQITLIATAFYGGAKEVAQVAKTLTLNHNGEGNETPVLTIDTISGDNNVDGGEIAAPFYITGQATGIPADSTVKLTAGDKIFFGTVTSEGVWSVNVPDLFSVKNGTTTHITISYQDQDGNQFAATRVIKTAAGSYPYHYPMMFEFDPIGGDNHLSGAEKHSDLIISSSRSSGEGLGIGSTVYVTLNGKTYTSVVEAGEDGQGYDNHWQVTVPASDVEALGPGSYTVVATMSDWLSWSGSNVTQVQAKIITVDADGAMTFSDVQSTQSHDASDALAMHAATLTATETVGVDDGAQPLDTASLGLHSASQPSLAALVDRLTATDADAQTRTDTQATTGAETSGHNEETALPPAPADMWHGVTAVGYSTAQSEDAAHHAPTTENALAELLQQQHLQPVV